MRGLRQVCRRSRRYALCILLFTLRLASLQPLPIKMGRGDVLRGMQGILRGRRFQRPGVCLRCRLKPLSKNESGGRRVVRALCICGGSRLLTEYTELNRVHRDGLTTEAQRAQRGRPGGCRHGRGWDLWVGEPRLAPTNCWVGFERAAQVWPLFTLPVEARVTGSLSYNGSCDTFATEDTEERRGHRERAFGFLPQRDTEAQRGRPGGCRHGRGWDLWVGEPRLAPTNCWVGFERATHSVAPTSFAWRGGRRRCGPCLRCRSEPQSQAALSHNGSCDTFATEDSE